jgi:esterase/lipase superfamily enzyme
MLEKAHINVVDLTALGSDDLINHGKFTQSAVVKAIGLRLASGQKLNDNKLTLGERLGGVVEGATDTVGKAAALAVSAPASVFDPDTRETLGDQATALGASAGRAVLSPADAAAR